MGRILVGLGLVVIGAVVLGESAGYWDAGDVIGTWWPLALIGLGAAQLALPPRPWLGAGIVIAIGAVLLLSRLDAVSVNVWDVVWPSVLIVIGLWLVVGRLRRSRPGARGGTTANVFAVLGEQKAASSATAFTGATVTAIFGGAQLDLRNAVLASSGATIDATGIFGSAEIIVPRGWDVRMSGLPLFGGIEDKTRREVPAPENAPRLTIGAVAIFGGVEVKNDA